MSIDPAKSKPRDPVVYEKAGALVVGTAAAAPTRPQLYLDTNLVSGLAKHDLEPGELEALGELLIAHKAQRLSIVTSAITKEEIARVPDAKRKMHELIYALLVDVPTTAESIPRPITNARGRSRLVGPLPHGDLTDLNAMLPDEADARHLYQAITNGVDYFVTADRRTILSRSKTVEARFPGIRIRLPSQVLSELSQ